MWQPFSICFNFSCYSYGQYIFKIPRYLRILINQVYLRLCHYTLSAKNFGEKKFWWKYFRWKKFRWLFARFRCNFRWKSSKFRWNKIWWKIFDGKHLGDFLPNIGLKFDKITENFDVNRTKKSIKSILFL